MLFPGVLKTPPYTVTKSVVKYLRICLLLVFITKYMFFEKNKWRAYTSRYNDCCDLSISNRFLWITLPIHKRHTCPPKSHGSIVVRETRKVLPSCPKGVTLYPHLYLMRPISIFYNTLLNIHYLVVFFLFLNKYTFLQLVYDITCQN